MSKAQQQTSVTEEARSIRSYLGDRSIVLIGLMGAGKTSVGRRLAAALGMTFTDADSEIEIAAGKTIPEIFTDHGEDHFRMGEARVIERLLTTGQRVLATGGGAFMNTTTRENIKQHGVSVWLRADLDLLMKRVSRRNNRPLLMNDNPEETMTRLMSERHPVYAAADVTVDSRDVPHDVIVTEIVSALDRLASDG